MLQRLPILNQLLQPENHIQILERKYVQPFFQMAVFTLINTSRNNQHCQKDQSQ